MDNLHDLSGKTDIFKFKDALKAEFFHAAEYLLNNMGQVGRETLGMLKNNRNMKAQLDAKYLDLGMKEAGVTKLKGKELNNFIDVLEGKAKPLNDNIAKSVKETRRLLDENRKQYIDTEKQYGDKDVAKKIEKQYLKDYFPHYTDVKAIEAGRIQVEKLIKSKDPGRIGNKVSKEIVDNIINKQNNYYSSAIRSIMEKDGVDFVTARGKLEGLLDGIKRNSAKHMTESRKYNLPYKRTIESLKKYITESNQVIADRMTFDLRDGENYKPNGRLDEMLGAIADESRGGSFINGEIARDLIDAYTGKKNLEFMAKSPQSAKVLRGLIVWNSVTKMLLSPLNNFSQQTNIHIAGKFGASYRGMVKYVKEWGANENVRASGALVKQIVEDYVQNKVLDKFYTINGMTASERMIRTVGTYVGYDHVLTNFEQAKIDMAAGKIKDGFGKKGSEAMRNLERVNLWDEGQILKQEQLTPEQIQSGAFEFTANTAFMGDAIGVTPITLSPLGKLVFPLANQPLLFGFF